MTHTTTETARGTSPSGPWELTYTRFLRVYYHDFNNPNLGTFVQEHDHPRVPEVGERILLRDYDDTVQVVCEVTEVTEIGRARGRSHGLLWKVAAKPVGPYEYAE